MAVDLKVLNIILWAIASAKFMFVLLVEPTLVSSDSTSEVAVEKISYLYKPCADASKSTMVPKDFDNSYVIEQTRFVETYPMRCRASTVIKDLTPFEPDFLLFTPNSERSIKATASKDEILAAGFEPSQRTTILVHGYRQSYKKTKWLREARNLFVEHSLVGHQNVIIMDWSVSSRGSFQKVAARASAMGSFLANFLMKLFDLGMDRKLVHVIGNSMGGHIAGFAGKRIQPKIGRITGLDVAGPCFGKLTLNSPNDRLNADDAHQVDVYHYNDVFLGLPEQVGQFDVFVNGGSIQPGCTNNINAMAQAFLTLALHRNQSISESHSRSTRVATSSLSEANECQMIAYECLDWSSFKAGECGFCDKFNAQCFRMDFNYQFANQLEPEPLRQATKMRLFIATGKQAPYCLHHYQIVVMFNLKPEIENENGDDSLITKTSNAFKQKWKINLELTNDRGELSSVIVSNRMQTGVYSYLLLSDLKPSRFRSAIVQARVQAAFGSGKLVPLYSDSGVLLQEVKINYMSNIDPEVRERFSSRLFPLPTPRKNELKVQAT